MFLNRTTFVLVRPQLPENIGMVARAMDNFGFNKLSIVSPREKWPNKKAIDASKNAKKIIENTKVFSDINEALNKFNLVIATTNRKRFLEKKTCNNFVQLKKSLNIQKNSAIIFGPENSGLSNTEIRLADYIFTIPTVNFNKSLNLSHAVSIIAYKIHEHQLISKKNQMTIDNAFAERASKKDLSKFMEHLIKILDKANFFKPSEKRESMINNIFSLYLKANLSKKEIQMLWGMLKKLSK